MWSPCSRHAPLMRNHTVCAASAAGASLRLARRVRVLLVVLPQEVLAVVVAVGGAGDCVDVLAGRGAAAVAEGDRLLVVELDQDDRAVDAVVEDAAGVGLAD